MEQVKRVTRIVVCGLLICGWICSGQRPVGGVETGEYSGAPDGSCTGETGPCPYL